MLRCADLGVSIYGLLGEGQSRGMLQRGAPSVPVLSARRVVPSMSKEPFVTRSSNCSSELVSLRGSRLATLWRLQA